MGLLPLAAVAGGTSIQAPLVTTVTLPYTRGLLCQLGQHRRCRAWSSRVRRIKEYADDGADITRIYRHQLAACTYEVLPGPGKLLRWSVPASSGHDDLLISTALTTRLDEIDWRDRTARGSG
jgi:hypothetical protein